MRGLAILILFQFMGLGLERFAHVPLPGNVIGMVLFLCALWLGWIKLEWVEATSTWLLKHMMLFFAPIIAGTVVFIPLLKNEWRSIVATLVISTLCVIVVTAWTAKTWVKTQQHEEKSS
jgi:holin-like protein